jgi:hypothetical protein
LPAQIDVCDDIHVPEVRRDITVCAGEIGEWCSPCTWVGGCGVGARREGCRGDVEGDGAAVEEPRPYAGGAIFEDVDAAVVGVELCADCVGGCEDAAACVGVGAVVAVVV